MFRRGLSLSVLLVGVLAAAPAQAALQWSDDSFHAWYGAAFREPANPNDIAKAVLTFTHADGYRWGGNFLSIDLLYSDAGDPVSAVPSKGAVEMYAVYRHTLSLNKVTDSHAFTLGPVVRDLGVVLGVDLNTKNNGFTSRKIMPIGGLKLSFDVPGFLDVELLVNKEWAVNGVTGQPVEFNVTPTLAAAWGIPLYGPISFQGFGSVNLPKGKDGFANDTATEVLLHPKLMVDVGKMLGSTGYELGVGYQYWLNKFGNDHTRDPSGGSLENALFGEVAVHL